MRDTDVHVLDIAAVKRIKALPEMLRVLCEVSGLGFAVLARVSENAWTACAVHDELDYGVQAGAQLDIGTTFCRDVRRSRTAIVIDRASTDPRYSSHLTPKIYGFESYISVPVILPDGTYFGSLCALDRRPAPASDPKTELLFLCFARLIAQQIELQFEKAARRARRRRRIVSNLRAGSPLIREPAPQAGFHEVADLAGSLESVVAAAASAHPGRTIISNISIEHPVWCDVARTEWLAKKLLGNALTQGVPGGPVSFIATLKNQELKIQVWNAGDASSPARDGWYACGDIARAHGGGIEMTSSGVDGTQVTARMRVAARPVS